MLDYAANAVKYWPAELIRTEFEQACEAKGAEPNEELRGFLGVDRDADQFWIAVKTNLQAGRIRMLFVADEIPDELRRVVEFLNEQMDPAEVLAVEIRQFAGPSISNAGSPRYWSDGRSWRVAKAAVDHQATNGSGTKAVSLPKCFPVMGQQPRKLCAIF